MQRKQGHQGSGMVNYKENEDDVEEEDKKRMKTYYKNQVIDSDLNQAKIAKR